MGRRAQARYDDYDIGPQPSSIGQAVVSGVIGLALLIIGATAGWFLRFYDAPPCTNASSSADLCRVAKAPAPQLPAKPERSTAEALKEAAEKTGAAQDALPPKADPDASAVGTSPSEPTAADANTKPTDQDASGSGLTPGGDGANQGKTQTSPPARPPSGAGGAPAVPPKPPQTTPPLAPGVRPRT